MNDVTVRLGPANNKAAIAREAWLFTYPERPTTNELGLEDVEGGTAHRSDARPYDPEPAARFVNEESKIIVIKGFKA